MWFFEILVIFRFLHCCQFRYPGVIMLQLRLVPQSIRSNFPLLCLSLHLFNSPLQSQKLILVGKELIIECFYIGFPLKFLCSHLRIHFLNFQFHSYFRTLTGMRTADCLAFFLDSMKFSYLSLYFYHFQVKLSVLFFCLCPLISYSIFVLLKWLIRR